MLQALDLVTALTSMKRNSASRQNSPDALIFSALSLNVVSALQLLYLNKKPEKVKKEKKDLRRVKKVKSKDTTSSEAEATHPGNGEVKETRGKKALDAEEEPLVSTESEDQSARDSVNQMMDTLDELARAEKLLRKKIKKSEKRVQEKKEDSSRMTDSAEQERIREREMLKAYKEQLGRLSTTRKTLESVRLSRGA